VPAITTNDLKNGITLDLDNGLFQVVEFQHVKPGKGGAFVRTKLRNVRTGAVLERTFNAGVRVEQAIAVAEIAQHGSEIIGVEIPASVELSVAVTEPGLQGDRVSGARKPAELETGKTVQVPLFVNVGDKVRVDTRSGEYITRV
jgi:elongation factor P